MIYSNYILENSNILNESKLKNKFGKHGDVIEVDNKGRARNATDTNSKIGVVSKAAGLLKNIPAVITAPINIPIIKVIIFSFIIFSSLFFIINYKY